MSPAPLVHAGASKPGLIINLQNFPSNDIL
jgi:hypothetical protein